MSPSAIPVSFLAGLLSFLAPCVLPLVPGYLSAVSAVDADKLGQPGNARRIVVASVPFVLGFTAFFVLLGTGAALVGDACGRRVRVWRVPQGLLDAAAALNLRLARLRGSAPMLTPGKVRELRHADWAVQAEPTPMLPGWQPRIGLAEGLRLTPGWR